MSTDLARLQSLRLKGRANAEALAVAWRTSPEAAQHELETLARAGLVQEKNGWFGLSDEGEAARQAALETERASLDASTLADHYEAFCEINGSFKQLVTDVQLGTLAAEDAPDRLAELHARFEPLAGRIGDTAHRLAPYLERFTTALDALRAGDSRYLASPMVESYHTLWFELHEELIQLLGRTRADEAAAGRA